MGIGRREFLRLTGLALAGLAVDPRRAVVTNDDVYVNKKLGIMFEKPRGWGFVAVKQFGELRDKQILGNGWEDFKDEIWEDLGDPICIATKYHQDLPRYKGVFSPTITLNVTPKSEFAEMEIESFAELMRLSEFGASLILEDLRVVRRYEPYRISGCHFYEYDAEYYFRHADLDGPLKTELKVLKAEHGDFYYDFNCHQSKAQNQTAHAEFTRFKETIKLV